MRLSCLATLAQRASSPPARQRPPPPRAAHGRRRSRTASSIRTDSCSPGVSRIGSVQSSSPHSQTMLMIPSRPSQAAPRSRSRSLRARKRTSFSATAAHAPARGRLYAGRDLPSRGMASEWRLDSTGKSWPSICRRARRRSTKRARSSTGSRLLTHQDARARASASPWPSPVRWCGWRLPIAAAASPQRRERCRTWLPSRGEDLRSSTRSRTAGRRQQQRDVRLVRGGHFCWRKISIRGSGCSSREDP